MKPAFPGMAAAAVILGATATMAERGHDPLALDHFIEANLSFFDAAPGSAPPRAADSGNDVRFAQQKLRVDAQGYVIGPDGKRIHPPTRIRWQIGVFR